MQNSLAAAAAAAPRGGSGSHTGCSHQHVVYSVHAGELGVGKGAQCCSKVRGGREWVHAKQGLVGLLQPRATAQRSLPDTDPAPAIGERREIIWDG